MVNRDDIIRMAQEVGLHLATDVKWMPIIGLEYAEKFAALVYAAGAAAEREKSCDLVDQVKIWREAYPLSIFPTPDWERVRDALEINGLTLDAVSAANIRHAIERFEEMIDETIRARGQE